jgi:chemotaxis protein MotA|tara:strand:- start:1455 stop:2288 length:834 start_codon:yes stop_codon:yes gene_type:complete
MDIATIIGFIVGLGLILFGMVDSVTKTIPQTFLNYQGIAIVLGGTTAATLINYPLKKILSLFKVAGLTFRGNSVESENEIISTLVEINITIRKKGIAGIEKMIDSVENRFLRNGLQYMTIEKDGEKLLQFLHNEMNHMIRRHLIGQRMFENMGTYAPAFGLLGTVMGLILMMTSQSIGDPTGVSSMQMENSMNNLLTGMGVSLVTTFYGVLLSNLVFNPISGKLKIRSEEEIYINEMMIMGIQSIHQKEHHLKMVEKLLTFLDKNAKEFHRSENESL